jgi:myosin-5
VSICFSTNVFDHTNNLPGLQTPRLKRLAEIVSAQAIAQQEKMEYGSQDGDYEDQDGHPHDGHNDLGIVHEGGEGIEAGGA